jgi:predicted  nucleic acid-binding Zn-ribbon protein
VSESDSPRPKRKKLTIGKPAEPAQEPELELAAPVAPPPPDGPSDPLDRNANIKLQLGFFVTVVGGITTAVAGYVRALQWVGFVGPLLAIIGFYLFGLSQGFVRRTDTRQQFADSCYFLGFLLTMVAMLVGFLPAGLLGEEITSQGILRHFSMALGATALGLVFRILVLQGGRSLGQITAEVETTLTQYARKVSEEARGISDELASLRAELDVQRQQVASIITTDLRDAVRSAFGPINESVATISTNLETQANHIAKSASLVQQAIGQSSDQLAAVAQLRSKANESAQTAVTNITDALQQFESQIVELRSQLTTVVSTSSHEIEKMTRALAQGTALAPSLAPALQSVAANVSSLSERIDVIGEQSDVLAQRVSNSLSDDGRLLGGIEEARDRMVASLDRAGEAARREIAQASSSYTQEVDSERQRAVETVRHVAEHFNSEVSAATDRLAEILKTFAARIEEAKR